MVRRHLSRADWLRALRADPAGRRLWPPNAHQPGGGARTVGPPLDPLWTPCFCSSRVGVHSGRGGMPA
eukprot:326530-Prorocentrum_minimum.AAC.1